MAGSAWVILPTSAPPLLGANSNGTLWHPSENVRSLRRCAVVAALTSILVVASSAQSAGTAEQSAQMAQVLKDYPGLFPEFGRLLEKMQREIQFPPPRQQSHLMPLLPKSTAFYAAFPNYGDVSHQGLAIFQQELQQSPELRAWWQRGDMATQAPKLEAAIEQFYQLSQYLGDEIVVSGAPQEAREPSFFYPGGS